MKYKHVFSKLEEQFDSITTEKCWSCSKPRSELFFLGENESHAGVTLTVIGKQNYIIKSGKQHNKFCPDFVMLTDDELQFVKSKLKLAAEIGEWKNVFIPFTPSTKIAVELFGDWWHSQDVIGISREEHVRQVENAYASIGWKVFIIWEEDFNKGIIPNELNPWLKNANDGFKDTSFHVDGEVVNCMRHPDTFKILPDKKKEEIINRVFKAMRGISLFPSRMEMLQSLCQFRQRLKEGIRSKGLSSSTGQKFCQYFCRSLMDAKPSGKRSMNELWNDDIALERAIYRQLNFFDGMQTVNRIRNELLRDQGYRVPGNFPPLKAAMLYQQMGFQPGDVVLDPCAGFGGRMFAAWAMGLQYIGVDANATLVSELGKMAAFLCSEGGVKPVIIHGAFEDASTLEKLKGYKFTGAFTSPPYFHLEDYSSDGEQAGVRYRIWDEFAEGFLGGLFENAGKLLPESGKFLLNVPEKASGRLFLNALKELAMRMGWRVAMEGGLDMKTRNGSQPEAIVTFSRDKVVEHPIGFGVKNADKNYYEPNFTEGEHYVVCKLCNGRFARLSQHLTRTHRMTCEEYLVQFPGALIQAEIDRRRVAFENRSKHVGKYGKRFVFKLPDGSIIKKLDAAKRKCIEGGWEFSESMKIDASTVCLDPWQGKLEDMDFVTCQICGYKGKNIKRHLKDEHPEAVKDYKGKVQCESSKQRISKASFGMWGNRKLTPSN